MEREESRTCIVTQDGTRTYLRWWDRVKTEGRRALLVKDGPAPKLPKGVTDEPKAENGGFSDAHFLPRPEPKATLLIADLPKEKAEALYAELCKAIEYGRGRLDVREWAKAAGGTDG